LRLAIRFLADPYFVLFRSFFVPSLVREASKQGFLRLFRNFLGVVIS
jgi:hypothetical protein